MVKKQQKPVSVNEMSEDEDFAVDEQPSWMPAIEETTEKSAKKSGKPEKSGKGKSGKGKGKGNIQEFSDDEDADEEDRKATAAGKKRAAQKSVVDDGKSQVYISNLAKTVTIERLGELFAEIGQLRHSFVVKDREGVSKGNAFVKFFSESEAAIAIEKFNGHELDGLRMNIVKAKENTKANENNPDDWAEMQKVKSAVLSNVPVVYRDHMDRLRSWLSAALPSGGIVHCSANSAEGPLAVTLTFSKTDQVARAVATLNGAQVKGGPALRCEVKAVSMQANSSRAGRVMIRNLPFSSTEATLKEMCAEFGTVTDAAIPKKPDGQMRGFGFVQFKDLASAEAAIAGLNGKKIKGRALAADMAVDKRLYDNLKSFKLPDVPVTTKVLSNKISKESAIGQESDDEAEEEEMAVEKAEPEEKKSKKQLKKERKAAEAAEAEKGEKSDKKLKRDQARAEKRAELEAAGLSKEEILEKQKAEKAERKAQREEENAEDDDEDEEELSSEEEDFDVAAAKIEAEKNGKKKEHQKESGHDIEEKRTLFVRNVAFDAGEDDLKEVFKRFGHILFVRLVKSYTDPSKHRGCAFVKFANADSVAKVLEEEHFATDKINTLMKQGVKRRGQDQKFVNLEGIGISIKGRRVHCLPALKPEESSEVGQEEKGKKTSAKEWAHLTFEGHIDLASSDAKGMHANELKMREDLRKERSFRSRNNNYQINPYSITIRNLPKNINGPMVDLQVKEFMIKKLNMSAKDAKMAFEPFSLVREKTKQEGQEERVSKGFGYMRFKSNDVARKVLHHMNASNDLPWSSVRRPVVEFTMEDKRRLREIETMQKKNAEDLKKQKANKKGFKPEWGGETAAKTLIKKIKKEKGDEDKKLSRGQKQREKRRALRAEIAAKGGEMPSRKKPVEYLVPKPERVKKERVKKRHFDDLLEEHDSNRKTRKQIKLEKQKPDTQDADLEAKWMSKW